MRFYNSATALFYSKLLVIFLFLEHTKKNQHVVCTADNFNTLTFSYNFNLSTIFTPIFTHFYCEHFFNFCFFNNDNCAVNARISPIFALFFFKYNKFFFFKYLNLSIFSDKFSSEINYNTVDAARMYYKLNKFAKQNNTDYPLDISDFTYF